MCKHAKLTRWFLCSNHSALCVSFATMLWIRTMNSSVIHNELLSDTHTVIHNELISDTHTAL